MGADESHYQAGIIEIVPEYIDGGDTNLSAADTTEPCTTDACSLQLPVQSGAEAGASRPYTCHICRKTFGKLRRLQAHIIFHSTKNALTCNTCKKQFARQRQLRRHMEVHETDGAYMCRICCRRFVHSYQLNTHMTVCRVTYNHSGKQFVCKICNRGFVLRGARDRHVITHSGQQPGLYSSFAGRYECNVCMRHYSSFFNLHQHMEIHGNLCPRTYADIAACRFCNVCKEHFSSSADLQQHMIVHVTECRFMCNVCGKRYTKHSNLYRHMWTHNPFTCEICQKQFTRPDRLEHHVLQHTYDKPTSAADVRSETEQSSRAEIRVAERSFPCVLQRHFSCKICSKRVTTKRSLARHLWNEHKRPISRNVGPETERSSSVETSVETERAFPSKIQHRFLCKICGKRYTTKPNLERHPCRPKNDQNDTGRSFKCEICHKEFTRPDLLNEHVDNHVCEPDSSRDVSQETEQSSNAEMHMPERPFPCKIQHRFACKICGKRYTKKSNLQRHMWRHTDDAYECELCQKLFTRVDLLKQHVDAHMKQDVQEHEHLSEPPGSADVRLKTEPSSASTDDSVDKVSKLSHVCDICSRTFEDERVFETHMRLHSRLQTLYQRK